jgi:hypothetical protein
VQVLGGRYRKMFSARHGVSPLIKVKHAPFLLRLGSLCCGLASRLPDCALILIRREGLNQLSPDVIRCAEVEAHHPLNDVVVQRQLKRLAVGKIVFGRGVEALDQPWVRHDLTEGDSLIRVCLQHSVDEVATF